VLDSVIQIVQQSCVFFQRVLEDFGLLPGNRPVLLFDGLGQAR